MKKIFSSLCLILIFCIFPLSINAASWKFTWSNTIVRIPVGQSINDYKDIPKATLYKDNFQLADANITYNQEGDWMYYLSDVNTARVGEYQVWYKAYETSKYFPGTCPGYKCKVKFIVEDNYSPKLEIINPLIKIKRNQEYDFNNNIRITDNYDTEFKVIFNSDINYSTVGVYNVDVYVEDQSGNYTSKSFEVEVYETSKPTIVYKNDGNILRLPLNGNIELSKYFEAFDVVDGDLTKYIKYPQIDNTVLGVNTYEFSVFNFAGLSSSIYLDVEIVDEVSPIIKVLDEVVSLDYKENISNYDFKKHIAISDNTKIDYDNLIITHDIVNKVGSYFVLYQYSDSAFTVSEEIEFKLLSNVKPQILIDQIVCYENEAIDLKSYIKVIDESDENILDSLKIYDNEVDYTRVGKYSAEAYVINSSGLSETVIFTIEVIAYDNDLNIESDINISNNNANNSFKLSPLDIILLIAVGGLITLVVFLCLKIKKNKSI